MQRFELGISWMQAKYIDLLLVVTEVKIVLLNFDHVNLYLTDK
jgi:hypothetical protein